ncbi:MAG: Uma2 family endonuclease [Gemmatimonadota bacterium]|nr:Uma2 family endonuclease [Gemmatimonadota bacterium]
METLTLDVSVLAPLTDEALYQLCVANRELRIERSRDGELIIRSPAGGESSRRNSLIVLALGMWNEAAGTGVVFDSSGGFLLPNGAMRAPDAAWVASERWERLSDEERRKFPPLCPDFVVELMSDTDRLPPLREKLQEWIENGCRLAWLIAPALDRAYIYRPGAGPREVPFTESLTGDDVLPGFTLPLEKLR